MAANAHAQSAPRQWPLEWRGAELLLLLLGAGVGLAAAAPVPLLARGQLTLADLVPALTVVALFLGLHLTLVLRGGGTDQVVVPVVQVLVLLALALVQRLAAGLDAPSVATKQTLWSVLAVITIAVVYHAPWDLRWLRRYRYTWVLLGLALVAVTFVAGHATVTGGPRLWLGRGALSFQPSEALKLLLVVFLAAYLSEKQELLTTLSTRLGPLALPPLPYLAPLAVVLGLSLALLAAQHDLGAALLLFMIALGLVYAASGRLDITVAAAIAFVVGAWLLQGHVEVVRTRTAIWLDPWSDARGNGYQLVQALVAVASGGVMGSGLGFGLPTAIPAVHTDFVYAAMVEELGLAGATAVLALYLVLVLRGFRIAVAAADPFNRLLAAGLVFALAVQAFIIVGGVVKVIPLTGITLPFLSYGGTSLVASSIAIGLLLRISRSSG